MNDGYMIGRDEHGVTAQERAVGQGLRDGVARNRIATQLGISRQRVAQIVMQLEEKGVNWQAWAPSKNGDVRRSEAAQADREAGIVEDHL